MVSPNQQLLDQQYMRQSLELAELAGQTGEVPVGAMVVFDGSVLGRGHNCCVVDHDPLGHAEVVAMKAAAKARGS